MRGKKQKVLHHCSDQVQTKFFVSDLMIDRWTQRIYDRTIFTAILFCLNLQLGGGIHAETKSNCYD